MHPLQSNRNIFKLLEGASEMKGDKCHLYNLVGVRDKHNKRPYKRYRTYLYVFNFSSSIVFRPVRFLYVFTFIKYVAFIEHGFITAPIQIRVMSMSVGGSRIIFRGLLEIYN